MDREMHTKLRNKMVAKSPRGKQIAIKKVSLQPTQSEIISNCPFFGKSDFRGYFHRVLEVAVFGIQKCIYDLQNGKEKKEVGL